ncbi:MAG: nodulation protein NfeD, partial [Deltaproteobacteria bacterium]
MDKKKVGFIIFAFLSLAIPSFSAPTDPYALSSQDEKVLDVEKKVMVVEIESVINPIIAEFIQNCIEQSNDDEAECLIITLDTPGGLDLSMRSIIKAIEDSKVPIVVYVAPSGARAASAGALITLASHIAAMAPGTNIGAAHPVSMGGQKMDEEMVKKVENDAAAYIRSLANKHNRNADWAEKAVRESVSITAREAKELKVIEIVASDLKELLNSIHERKVTIRGEERKLNTKEATVATIDMGLRHRILNTISDPNIAYILMMIGMWGLFFELSNPGVIFPGVIGGISLILAFVAFQTLPINYAGILLIILGMIFFIAEIKVTSFGLLTIGGIISLLLGS